MGPRGVRAAELKSVRFGIGQKAMAPNVINCVIGETLVHTASGLRRIDKIAAVEPNSEVGLSLQVYNRDGDVVVASKLFHSGSHPTFRLVTSEGFEVTGTANHPVLCLADRDGVPVLAWKLLGEVKPGTRVNFTIEQGQGGMYEIRAIAPAGGGR